MKRIGVLTGGGDCPGLNAVLRAVVRRAIDQYYYRVMGIKKGWLGLINGDVEELTLESVSGILPRGGTILFTSRTNPYKVPEGEAKVFENIKKYQLDCIIAVGGEDTLGVAHKLFKKGVNIVGVPKTIDNDLACTDYTFGFDTAVSIVTDAIDRLHSTAESHHRVMVVEVMGRHAGWIATVAGIAGGADVILIPEISFEIAEVCDLLKRRQAKGKQFSIVVVAEGCKPKDIDSFITQDAKVDQFGHVRLGGIGNWVGETIERCTGIETRVTILGHIQRGGSPTAFDRVLATRFGVSAVDLIAKEQYGYMVSLEGNKIVAVTLEDAVAQPKTVDMELYEVAKVFFG